MEVMRSSVTKHQLYKISTSDVKVGKKYTAFLLMHSGSNKLFRIFKIERMKIEDVR